MGAFRINTLAKLGPFSRAKLFRDIAAGRLIARKVGGATLILESDWAEYLKGSPRRITQSGKIKTRRCSAESI